MVLVTDEATDSDVAGVAADAHLRPEDTIDGERVRAQTADGARLDRFDRKGVSFEIVLHHVAHHGAWPVPKTPPAMATKRFELP